MYADSSAIRVLARRMRARADDIRLVADELAKKAESAPWSGLAADAMRRTAYEHARRLRRCATSHQAAADALDRHAREVDHHLEVIAAVEQTVSHRIEHVLERCL